MTPANNVGWLWDVPLDPDTFAQVLRGERIVGELDWRWALVRLIEYALYEEILRLLPRRLFVEHWPELAPQARSATRREGMTYVRQRLLPQA